MRLWSIHPRYLDGMGLGVVWKEGLLAQVVIRVVREVGEAILNSTGSKNTSIRLAQ